MRLYNTLTRRLEEFESLVPGRVGMYVCGPTVYGDPHLGHARPAITFDVLYRALLHQGYKVRYVRNITDVGHLEHDADAGEDKIAKKARLEQLEPMEVAQYYTERYHSAMRALGVLAPSIEPRASGHILEQMAMARRIEAAGYAYRSNGSLYFDVAKYNERHHYGRLSGRDLENTVEHTRALQGQAEKRNPYDFALWKRAEPQHIMHWPSEWSEGFPGWHLECSAMSLKYLGERFDIHGGGMDLLFPHHECEVAQSTAALGHESVRYWVHNNMVTINGQKMGKSLGNFITLEQFLTGSHPLLSRAYSAMAIRLFILQAHYRSTLDFSDAGLQSAEKGLERLREAWGRLLSLSGGAPARSGAPEALSGPLGSQLGSPHPESCPGAALEGPAGELREACEASLLDDLGTPGVVAALFEACKVVNGVADGQGKLTSGELSGLRDTFRLYAEDLLGLRLDAGVSGVDLGPWRGAVDLLLEMRGRAKARKDYAESDEIRRRLEELGFTVKDGREGSRATL